MIFFLSDDTYVWYEKALKSLIIIKEIPAASEFLPQVRHFFWLLPGTVNYVLRREIILKAVQSQCFLWLQNPILPHNNGRCNSKSLPSLRNEAITFWSF